MTKTFDIQVSEIVYKTVRLEAKNITEAEDKINNGLWNKEDVIDEDSLEFMIHETTEVKEVA
jgi:hypothetical protein